MLEDRLRQTEWQVSALQRDGQTAVADLGSAVNKQLAALTQLMATVSSRARQDHGAGPHNMDYPPKTWP